MAADDFAIYDPRMQKSFWHYYRTDSIHSYYPRGSKEEVEAFATPFWLAK